MKNKLRSLIAFCFVLVTSCSAFAAGQLVFQPQFQFSGVNASAPAVSFSDVQASGYFSSKDCAVNTANNPETINCNSVNPYANETAGLTADFAISGSATQQLVITKGSGDSLSNGTIATINYTDPTNGPMTCSLNNGSGSIASNQWTLPFSCSPVAVQLQGYGVTFNYPTNNTGLTLGAPSQTSFASATWAYQGGAVSISSAAGDLYDLSFNNTQDDSAFLNSQDTTGLTLNVTLNGSNGNAYNYPILITKASGSDYLTVAQGANVNLPNYTKCSPILTGAGTNETITLNCTSSTPPTTTYTYGIAATGDTNVTLTPASSGETAAGATWSNSGSMNVSPNSGVVNLTYSAYSTTFSNTGTTSPFSIIFNEGGGLTDTMPVQITKSNAGDGLTLTGTNSNTITLKNYDTCTLPAGAVVTGGSFKINCVPAVAQAYNYILQAAPTSGLPAGVGYDFSKAVISNVANFSNTTNTPQANSDAFQFYSTVPGYSNLHGSYTVTVPLTGTSSAADAVTFNVLKVSTGAGPTVTSPSIKFTSPSGLTTYQCAGATPTVTPSSNGMTYTIGAAQSCTSTPAISELNYGININGLSSNYALALSSNLITNAPSWMGQSGDINLSQQISGNSASLYAKLPNFNTNYYADAGTFTINLVVNTSNSSADTEIIPVQVSKAANSLNLTTVNSGVSFNLGANGTDTYSWAKGAVINPTNGNGLAISYTRTFNTYSIVINNEAGGVNSVGAPVYSDTYSFGDLTMPPSTSLNGELYKGLIWSSGAEHSGPNNTTLLSYQADSSYSSSSTISLSANEVTVVNKGAPGFSQNGSLVISLNSSGTPTTYSINLTGPKGAHSSSGNVSCNASNVCTITLSV